MGNIHISIYSFKLLPAIHRFLINLTHFNVILLMYVAVKLIYLLKECEMIIVTLNVVKKINYRKTLPVCHYNLLFDYQQKYLRILSLLKYFSDEKGALL